MNLQVVVTSISAANLAGLPDAEVLQALLGYSLLRTDQTGWIELITDGERLWVEVER